MKILGGLPERKPNLLQRARAKVAGEEESSRFFAPNDFRWAETVRGQNPTVYINDEKFRRAGVDDGYRDKMATLESIHLLKDADPKLYERIYSAAMSDPGYVKWAKNSYQRALNDPSYKETRNFEDWHRESRFDQVVGGYMMAGDPDIPPAKNWTRDRHSYGEPFKRELKKLESYLFPGGYKKGVFDPKGRGYDYQRAISVGMGPSEEEGENFGHWGSVAPVTEAEIKEHGLSPDSYVILKGANHPTFDKTVAGEEARGYMVRKFGDRYFSVPNIRE